MIFIVVFTTKLFYFETDFYSCMKSPIISVIDDDPQFQYITNRMIDRVLEGHRILQFSDGFQAIKFMRSNISTPSNLPQLIFLDINMPNLSGWQFIEQLSLILSEDYLPVIYMVSSSTDKEDIDRATTYEKLKGYLVKPLTIPELKRIFDEL